MLNDDIISAIVHWAFIGQTHFKLIEKRNIGIFSDHCRCPVLIILTCHVEKKQSEQQNI